MSDTLFLLFCFNSLVHSDAGWSSQTSTLIREIDSFAVGAYNNSIFLLGSPYYQKQITEYRIDTDTFINIGLTELAQPVYGFCQFWAQKENIIYMINPLTQANIQAFSKFDMKIQHFNANWNDIEVNVYSNGCLAMSNDYLYVAGAYNDNRLQIMDIKTYVWTINPPRMKELRGYHSCIVHYNHLWVFGGYNGNYLESNERINIIDIQSNQWSYIESLTVTTKDSRAVAWQENIFIIGGATGSNSYSDRVHIVDSTTGTVTLSPDRLPYPVSSHGVVLTNNVIYVFGGYNGDGYLNKWMKYTLSTISTTTSNVPSTAIQSTVIPSTAIPSNTPSQDSTTNPTTDTPSYAPTDQYKALIHSNATFLSTQYLRSETKRTTLNNPNPETTLTVSTSPYQDPLTPSNTPSQDLLTPSNTPSPTDQYKGSSQTPILSTQYLNGSIPYNGSSYSVMVVLVFIAASIAVFCVCCLCILLIWKSITQKQRNPEPHDAAGRDRPQREPQYLDQPQYRTPVALKRKVHKDALDVQYWLENVLNLPQYFDAFMDSGYESMEFIKEIPNMTELLEIGIESKKHQHKIFEEIKKLKGEEIDDIQRVSSLSIHSNDTDITVEGD